MGISGKLGFIGGGRMAEALIQGILHADLLGANQILVADPSGERRDLLRGEYNVAVYEDSGAIWQECGIIILAVKPQIVVDLLKEFQSQINDKHLLISIAAGIPLGVLESCLAGCGCRIIRVMPNTPAIIQEGMSALSPGKRATAEDAQVAKGIFDAVGTSVVLDESLLDAVTGLSGSGPAYVFSFIEALIDAGLKVGISRPIAEILVLQTMLGSVKLAIESKAHPAELRAMVTSPGGTTIAGLHEFERAGFRGIIMDAVEAATRRSQELGKNITKSDKP